MSTPITMPQLGETVTEGTVIAWLAQPGDTVTEGQPVVEVSTDKVDSEIPAPATGQLSEIVVSVGETIEVGAVIGHIGGDTASDTKPETATSSVSSKVRPEATRVRASPAARVLARERSINLVTIAGTGPEGAIIKRDVEAMDLRSGAVEPQTSPVWPDDPGSVPPPVQTSPVIGDARRAMAPAGALSSELEVDTTAIDIVGDPHPFSAFVIRALVDAIRAAARVAPAWEPVVDPTVACYEPGAGLCVTVEDAAGLRLAALGERLRAAEPGGPTPADVALIDCTALSSVVSGAPAAPVGISIAPRRTVPSIEQTAAGLTVALSERVPIMITVDAERFTVVDVHALAARMKANLETRDWSAEL